MYGLTKIAPGTANVGITDRPEPDLRPGHVILDVEAAGICGTDVHIIDDEFASRPPVIMGHEVCGVVSRVAEDVDETRWLERRVVSETYFSTCEACVHCLGGRRNLYSSGGRSARRSMERSRPDFLFQLPTFMSFPRRWQVKRRLFRNRSPASATRCSTRRS